MARRLAPAASAPWLWAAVGGVVGLVLTWILALPAPWLASRIGQASGGQVLLQEARGTVWNGTAQLVFSGGPGSSDATALPTRLAWHMRPAWNGLRVELSSECCTPTPLALDFRPGWRGGRLLVADGQSQWPAALLAGLGTPWNTLQLEGDFSLQTRALALEWAEGRVIVAGNAELLAQRVASRVSTLRPLGSYKLDLAGGATPRLQLSTLEGALQLQGSGQWVGPRLRFTGEASAAPDREAALANLLNIIGRRNGARSIITIG